MNTLHLESMGLESLSQNEMMESEGGGFWETLGNIAGALAIVGFFVSLVTGVWVIFLAGAAVTVLSGCAAVVAGVLDPNGTEFGDFMAGLNELLPWQA